MTVSGGRLEQVLNHIPNLTIGVVGDLFLDRYLDIDAALTEPSIETGLDAYQVVRVRNYPGAAGTVINNLVALGVKRVMLVTVVGDDGEWYELSRALDELGLRDCREWIHTAKGRRTPTYTKPMLHRPGEPPRELNRLDIKNRLPLTGGDEEEAVLRAITEHVISQVDALLVLDQVSEAECGVITTRVRQRLADLGQLHPDKLILADSRERIGLFRSVWTKPNLSECRRAVDGADDPDCVTRLAELTGRPVFCTRGAEGILIADPRPGAASHRLTVPAYPVSGPIDIVGAGDSTTAGIACALALGATLEEAAAFGNLVASITIQQLGTTGTATPDQVRRRWREVRG
jgi:bifunctional ADP-heptose synthase (sugar kinase/adenylyltransferase)